MTENEDIEKILYMGVGRSGIDNENSKIAKALNELMQYRAIGTVEDIRFLVENIGSIKLLKEYNAIGTIEEFKVLKEKAEPKKVIRKKGLIIDKDKWGNKYYEVSECCPSCNFSYAEFRGRFCINCGQKLDWQ